MVVRGVATPELDFLIRRAGELRGEALINHESGHVGVSGGNVVDTGDHGLSVAYAASGGVLCVRAVHRAGPPHVSRVNGAAPLDFLIRTASDGAKGLINELVSESGTELFKCLRGFSWHGVRGFLLGVVYIIHCIIDALYVSA